MVKRTAGQGLASEPHGSEMPDPLTGTLATYLHKVRAVQVRPPRASAFTRIYVLSNLCSLVSTPLCLKIRSFFYLWARQDVRPDRGRRTCDQATMSFIASFSIVSTPFFNPHIWRFLNMLPYQIWGFLSFWPKILLHSYCKSFWWGCHNLFDILGGLFIRTVH